MWVRIALRCVALRCVALRGCGFLVGVHRRCRLQHDEPGMGAQGVGASASETRVTGETRTRSCDGTNMGTLSTRCDGTDGLARTSDDDEVMDSKWHESRRTEFESTVSSITIVKMRWSVCNHGALVVFLPSAV